MKKVRVISLVAWAFALTAGSSSKAENAFETCVKGEIQSLCPTAQTHQQIRECRMANEQAIFSACGSSMKRPSWSSEPNANAPEPSQGTAPSGTPMLPGAGCVAGPGYACPGAISAGSSQ